LLQKAAVHRRRIHSRALRREGDRSFSLSLYLFLSFFLTLFLFLSFSLFLSLSPFYIFLSSIQDEIVSNHSLSYGHDIYLGTSRVSSGGLSQRRDMNFDFRAERGVFYVSLLIFSQRYTRKTSRAARASDATHRASSCNNLCTILQPTTSPTI